MTAELRFSRSDSEQSAPAHSVAALSVARSLSIARWCASKDWPVHPLAPGRKTPAANCKHCSRPGHTRSRCQCLPKGRWCHGFHAATVDPALIERWWGRNPDLGVGVACGAARLVVIDIDDHPSRCRAATGSCRASPSRTRSISPA